MPPVRIIGPFKGFVVWVDNDLTAESGGALWTVGTDLDAYCASDGTQHVNFLGVDGDLHELYNPGTGWTDNDLTRLAPGSTAPSELSRLAGYAGTDGSQHVNFVGFPDSVYELYAAGAGWTENTLPSPANPASPGWGSPLDGYWGGDGSQHVNYLDEANHLHELYHPPGGGGWADNDLTSDGGGVPAQQASALAGCWAADNSQHVIYMDQENQVLHRMRWLPGSGWSDVNFATAAIPPPAPALETRLACYGYGAYGGVAVNYVDNNSNVHHLIAANPYGGPGYDCNLTQITHADIAWTGALAGFWGGDGTPHVFYLNYDFGGHVHEVYWDAQYDWQNNDLTSATGQGPVSQWSPLAGYWGSDGSPHITYATADGHIHQMSQRWEEIGLIGL